MKLFGSEQNLQSAVAIFVNENALNSDTCCRVISHRLGFYPSSSVHTGGPSSKELTRIDVMQKPFFQLCCFYDSVHRVSAHDVGSGSISSSHVGSCVKPAFTWRIIRNFRLKSCDVLLKPSAAERENPPLRRVALESAST